MQLEVRLLFIQWGPKVALQWKMLIVSGYSSKKMQVMNKDWKIK